MDRLIYVAMTGARESMRAQSVVSHNIANAGTIGFRALQHSLQSAPVPGWGFPSRINAVSEPNLVDTSTGVMISTGRNLDIAIRGQGWLAVQAPDGEEAYTRGGNLRVTPEGMLETANGHLVLGNGGPISLPPYQKLAIGGDGQISIVPQGQKGLFRLKDGEPPAADPSVLIANGQLETSNVNPAQALVQMIELSRHYEMQVRAMHNAEQNDQAAARLMRMNG
jgi:flagellar basal-body rod protein FlgF